MIFRNVNSKTMNFNNKPYFFANWAFNILGFSLPISLLLSNYLFALAIIILIFNSSRIGKIDWLPFLVLLIPALIPVFSIYFHSEPFSLASIDVKLPFIIVALLIGFLRLDAELLSKFKFGFIFGTLIGSILSLMDTSIFVHYLQESSFLDISYISLYIVISLIYLWFTSIEIKTFIKIILGFVFILILFFLGDSLFITSGLIIVFAAIIIKGTPLQSRLAIGFVVILFSIFLYKGAEIQEHLHENSSETEELSGVDKLAQWQCVLEVMEGNELFGVGYASKEVLLTQCYHEHAMFKAETNVLNSHNEYLDSFLTLGYIGVLGLLLYFFRLGFEAYDNKLVAQLLVIILIGLFSITENVFTRQKGVMITSITCLMIFSSGAKLDGENKAINPTV